MRTTLVLVTLCACGGGLDAVNTKGNETSPPKTYGGAGSALSSPCDFTGALRPVLAGATATEAFLIRSDGSKVVLLKAEGTQTWISPPIARGGFVTVATTSIEAGRYVSRMKLFDADGKELGSAAGGGGSLSELGVAASWAHDGGLLLLFADGSTRVEVGLTPAADFGPGGLLPVWKGDSRQLALLDVSTHAVKELRIPVAGWSSPAWSGDMLVYLGEAGGMLQLVRLQGDVERTTTIVASNLNAGLEVEQVTDDFAVLVAGSWVQTRSRLDLVTGELTPLDVKQPEGMLFAGRASARLADDGSLVAAFRKDGAAGLFRSLDGVAWAPLGPGVEGATWVEFIGRQGSWVMSTAGALGWSSAKATALVPSLGRTVELPSPAGGDLAAEALSHDGRCVAVWGADGALTAVDLVKGTSRVLLQTADRAASASWLR